MNKYTVITLFPEFVAAFAATGIVRRAVENGHVTIDSINPRDFTPDGRGQVDDAPYGGGPGMVMAVAPLRAAICAAKERHPGPATVVFLSPQGRQVNQAEVAKLTTHSHIILVAGRYEGIDERVVERDIDIELSLGDFVMSGGEIAAVAVVDAVVRLLPGALGSELSAVSDSFSDGLLEHGQYTRPESIDGQTVPKVLLGGNHGEIERWRRRQSLGRTWARRPELLAEGTLSDTDQRLLDEYKAEIGQISGSSDDVD